MANPKIVLKNSTVSGVVPSANDLDIGEVALNLADNKFFTKNNAGQVIQLNTTHQEVIDLIDANQKLEVFEYDSVSMFPASGVDNVIYIDKQNDELYRWDVSTSMYVRVGGETTPAVVDGGVF